MRFESLDEAAEATPSPRSASPENTALARVRRLIESDDRLAPVHSVFDVRFTRADVGVSVAEMPTAIACDDAGQVDVAAMLVLVDAVLGSSVGTSLPEGRSISTLTMHVQTHDLAVGHESHLVGTSTVTHTSDQSGTAHGQVRTPSGTLVASIATRCVLRTGQGLSQSPGAAIPARPVDADPRQWTHNVRVAHSGPDHGVVTASALPDWGNTAGRVQGGGLAAVAERALHEIWVSRGLEHSGTYDLHLTFMAGVVCDGHDVTGDARLMHAGRSVAVAQARVLDDDRTAVFAQASRYLKREGRMP